jgi:protein-arginine kinase activator protein McsA
MIKLTEILQDIIAEKKLCPKGRAYYNRRRAAGEKPSAYLSGRAVKVCKGLMEENEGMVKCEKCNWEWDLEDGGNEPYVCHKCGHNNSSIDESLRDWFKKEDWVRIDTAGNITGPCGTMKKGNKTTRCLPRAKANSLSKAERAATSKKKAASDKQFVPNTKKAKVRLNK